MRKTGGSVFFNVFQNKWLNEFDWLLYRDNLMFCHVCCDFKHLYKCPDCVFITGSDRFRKDPLTRHNESPDHLKCMEAQAAQRAPEDTPLATKIEHEATKCIMLLNQLCICIG